MAETRVDIDNTVLTIDHVLERLVNDETTKLMIHNALAKRCDPYVPFLEGPLSQSALAQVTPDYVQYGNSSVPYAHYQYVGVNFNHTLDYHPKATAYWDKVMMQEQGDIFRQEVQNILEMRANQI